jgi:hypothetical protein
VEYMAGNDDAKEDLQEPSGPEKGSWSVCPGVSRGFAQSSEGGVTLGRLPLEEPPALNLCVFVVRLRALLFLVCVIGAVKRDPFVPADSYHPDVMVDVMVVVFYRDLGGASDAEPESTLIVSKREESFSELAGTSPPGPVGPLTRDSNASHLVK